MGIFKPVATDIDYHPLGTGHDGQKMNLFIGKGYPPSSGRPVLVSIEFSGFSTSQRVTQYNASMSSYVDRLMYNRLQNGWAGISASVTVLRGAPSPNNVSDASYDPAADEYGYAYDGNGTCIPPGENPGGAAVEPFLDLLRPMCLSDICHIRTAIERIAGQYGLDVSRLAVIGVSAGGMTGMFGAHSIDRRGAFHAGNETDDASTLWRACIAARTPTRYLTIQQDIPSYWNYIPDMDAGNAPDFDVPSGPLTDTLEGTYGYQEILSPLNYLDTSRPVTPTYFAYDVEEASTVFDPPYEDDVATDYHGRESGQYFRRRFGGCRVVSYGGLAPLAGEDAQLSVTGGDASTMVLDMASWLEEVMDAQELQPMTRVPTQATEAFVNASATWAGYGSTSNTVWTQVATANPNRKQGVWVYNVSSDGSEVRVAEEDAASHGGILVGSIATSVIGGALQLVSLFCPGTGEVWIKRNGASGTAAVIVVEV